MGKWSPEALRSARRRYEAEHGDITLEQIGQKVADLLGEEKAPSVAVLSYTFRNGREPRFSLGVALAKVLEADAFEIGLARVTSPASPAKRPKMRVAGGAVLRGARRRKRRRA